MGRIVENFTQFLQQAAITQAGDPYIFGKNPKKKPSRPKKSQVKAKPKQPASSIISLRKNS